ncbi:BLUF domain-containing protein [Tsuneonella sp. HG249]
MRRVVYISTATGLSAEEVDRLVESAQRNNAERGISGFLIYNGRNFLQLIEGEQAALMSLMATLARDPRHSGMLILIDEPIDARSCPTWSMHHMPLSLDIAVRRDSIRSGLPEPISPYARQLVENFAALN